MRLNKTACCVFAQTWISFAVVHTCAAWITPQGFAQSPAQLHLQQATLLNTLDSAGKAPFHIKIAFQLYDLAGNSSDKGFIEEWWASPGISRVTVSAASLKTSEPVPLNDELAMDPREKFLVLKLLQATLHPIPAPGPSSIMSAKEAPQKFDIATLTCFTTTAEQVGGNGMGPSKYCIDPATNAIRIQLEGQMSTTSYNSLGTFHDTHVSLAIDIAYTNLQAISGKVTLLQSFDPGKSDIVFPAAPAEQHDKTTMTAPRTLNHSYPIYPNIAKASHIKGAVLLHAIISKQGTMKDIFVLASPSPALTQAAIDAVQTWTYKPSQLNGQPADVDTLITLNFNFGSGN